MLVVLLLRSCYWRNHQIEAQYVLLFLIIFPIDLKQNYREESTRDKWPIPYASFVGRFYCTVRSVQQIRPSPLAFLAQSLAEVFLSQLLRGSVPLPRPSTLKLIGLSVASGPVCAWLFDGSPVLVHPTNKQQLPVYCRVKCIHSLDVRHEQTLHFMRNFWKPQNWAMQGWCKLWKQFCSKLISQHKTKLQFQSLTTAFCNCFQYAITEVENLGTSSHAVMSL